MNTPNVAVVMLNFNGRSFLEKFLPTVIAHSAPHKIYVADNGSTDDSVAFIRENFPLIGVIENKGNYGYAKGYNLALKKITADYFILINSDVEVTSGWIEPVISLMENDRQIAACQPKLLDYSQRTAFEYAGASGGFIDKFGYPFCRGRLFNTIEADLAQFNDAREVFWATGACLFVNAAAFWKVGGLDDDYFAHMEEIDLCWRLKNLGYTVYVEPASLVYHVGGGTLHKVSPHKTFLNFRNNLATLAKNHPGKNLFPKIVFRLALDGIAACKFLAEGQPMHFFAVIKAHFAFYSWLPALCRKRRALHNAAGFRFSFSHIYKGNIAVEYFLKNKRTFSDLRKGFFQK